MTIDGQAACRSSAELVVEDLERQQAVVARGEQSVHEILQRKLTLAGKIAVVTAPGQVVHVENRRVGNLDQEDAVARDRADGAEVSLAGEDMERVEHDADRRMVGAPHQLPRIPVVVDVPTPCEGLESDAQSAFGSTFAQLAQVGRRAVDAAEALRRYVEQIISRSQPSSCIRSNLRSARWNTRARRSVGMPSKSRKGWNVMVRNPRPSIMRRTSAGVPLNDNRSFSNISTPLNPAAAIASSFSFRTPLRQTVAIAVCIVSLRTTLPARSPAPGTAPSGTARSSCAIMNGQTPLMMSSMLIRETPQTTFSTTPTGGVIRPMALLMMNSTPK